MNQLITLFAMIAALVIGSILGYLARQSIAKRNYKTIEAKLQKKVSQAKEESEQILFQAKEKASQVVETVKKEEDKRRENLLKTERLLLRRENALDEKITNLEDRDKDFNLKVDKLKEIKENIEKLQKTALDNLERISGLSKENAKKEFIIGLEREYQKDFAEKSAKLEAEGWQQFEKRAKEILTLAIQKCAVNQSQETTTTTVSLPSEDLKGRIIGKEGRNIKTLERLAGVEIIVDETPEAVVISAFDPIRRQVAKLALEKLMQDGRIQPARIEETVVKAKEEIAKRIKEAGDQAVYEVGLYGLDPKLVLLLGRLRFRTSYGQNVLLHAIEVALLSSALAAELGADTKVALKAGFLHDIGKAVDQQVEGSHVDIGIKILEKFKMGKEIIDAMKSHHEDYPYTSLESIIIQTADAISGARPGARKDTLENYLKRLGELEKIATDFQEVEKAWALQAGREIRVFVKPEEIDDFGAKKLAKEIANRIQEELKYPGEIKVTVIRESRVIEYAK
ncbi:ribonuclease Y [Patescibacteria group bacterium]